MERDVPRKRADKQGVKSVSKALDVVRVISLRSKKQDNEKIIGTIVCVVLVGACIWLIIQRQPTPTWHEENTVERYIRIVADGPILHYQETLFWGEDQFVKIMENWNGFRSAQIEKFNQKYHVAADNFNVEFDEKNRTTTLKCDVPGKEYAENSYDFLWFLNVYGLDLIYDFTESERELSWTGITDNLTTTIVLSFPFPIDHCHGHVWQARR